MLQLLLAANTELSYCCCEGCDFTLTERSESPGDRFQKLPNLDGSDLLRVNFTLVVRDALFWDICDDFLRFYIERPSVPQICRKPHLDQLRLLPSLSLSFFCGNVMTEHSLITYAGSLTSSCILSQSAWQDETSFNEVHCAVRHQSNRPTRQLCLQRLGTHCWANLQRRHHKSTETDQAVMPIWLAVEVTLNGTSRRWDAAC